MARLVRKLSFDSKPSAGRTGQAPVRRNSFGSKTSRRQWSALSALADGEPSASAAAVDHHFIATADMSALGLGRVSGPLKVPGQSLHKPIEVHHFGTCVVDATGCHQV